MESRICASLVVLLLVSSIGSLYYATKLVKPFSSTETVKVKSNCDHANLTASNELGLASSIVEHHKNNKEYEYKAAQIEKYVMDNLANLGYDKAEKGVHGCTVWKDPNATNKEIHKLFGDYLKDLNEHYTPAISAFKPIPDLMENIRKTGNTDICKSARLHPDGLKALFNNSNQLSYSSNTGFVEPLTTPMRHPSFCWNTSYVLNINYLIHDFERMCQTLKPTSRRVFLDIGADLSRENGPVLKLLDLYSKFGFEFDHIYGIEMKFTEPSKVYKDQLPEKYLASFHWINTAANATKDAKLNPLYSIINKFDKDDLIIVKLDIDHAETEMPLATQLLEDERFHNIVDHFYFEHHVFLGEIARWWGKHMKGSIKDSFEIFSSLREKGIASHFWI